MSEQPAGPEASEKPVPSIPRHAPVDVPPGGEAAKSPAATASQVEVKDPEGNHRRGMERSKLRFAFALTASCTAAAVGIGLLEYFLPSPESGRTLTGIIDLLKLLATTALGYVFGRSLSKGE